MEDAHSVELDIAQYRTSKAQANKGDNAEKIELKDRTGQDIQMSTPRVIDETDDRIILTHSESQKGRRSRSHNGCLSEANSVRVASLL